MELSNIRNFCILAHIDHGKSTLADRILEFTGTVPISKMRDQFLDSLALERERGVTIKLKAVRLQHKSKGISYIFNLIDTPGHVDFSYEVSRSLKACEGAVLLVDATSGIQAQTLAHFERAKKANLKIIPVVNKIDALGAQVEETISDLISTFEFSPDEILKISAKVGTGVSELLERVIDIVPPPAGNPSGFLRAMVFDSKYDEHKGVVAFIRIIDGSIKIQKTRFTSRKFKFIGTGAVSDAIEVGFFTPGMVPSDELVAGEVGYLATGLKEIRLVRVGDTLTFEDEVVTALSGYQEPQCVVFASLYPLDPNDFQKLRDGLNKLSLTDAALTFKPESSSLGRGYSVGFLGAFHAEIVKERLERDYNLSLLLTRPGVEYRVVLGTNEEIVVRDPKDFPDDFRVAREPWVKVTIFTPVVYLGGLMTLSDKKRGAYLSREYHGEKVKIEYEMPLSEMVFDYYDKLKSVSSGFASLDWEFLDYRPIDVVRLDILIHDKKIPGLSHIVLRRQAQEFGTQLVAKLKDIIPQQLFQVAIQAAISGRIVARENVSARRKNVLAKLSGGHRERKDKVLERQKKGKKEMAKFGQVEVPQEAFRITVS